jgi:hypothetical protein
MTDTKQHGAGSSPRGRRPQWKLEPAPYDLKNPLEPPPARIRKDPRIRDQHRTAFWVVVGGRYVGRVVMVEYEDRRGWYYAPEVAVPGERFPKAFDEPKERRQEAVLDVVDEYRRLRSAG